MTAAARTAPTVPFAVWPSLTTPASTATTGGEKQPKGLISAHFQLVLSLGAGFFAFCAPKPEESRSRLGYRCGVPAGRKNPKTTQTKRSSKSQAKTTAAARTRAKLSRDG